MEMKTCPFCGEQILPEAIKCKHCHEFIVDELPEELLKKRQNIRAKLEDRPVGPPPRAPISKEGHQKVLWQGGPSLLYWAGSLFEIALLAVLGLFVALGGQLLARAGVSLAVPLVKNVDIVALMQTKYVIYLGWGLFTLAVVLLSKCWLSILGAGKYTVTTARISERTGFISNHTNEIRVADIRGLNVRQTAWQRILGLGTLEIGSAASAGEEIHFRGIKSPRRVRNVIIEAQNQSG
jgi:Bacterial PH domain